MKMLKLVLSLAFLFVAQATFASATLTSVSVSGYGGGSAALVAIGSNGNWEQETTGTSGSLANLSDVLNLRVVVLIAQPASNGVEDSECSLTIPEGATATVTYSASMGSSSGSVYARVGSNTYYAPALGSTSGSVSLSSGTYVLKAYGYVGPNGGGSMVQISVEITYP